VPLTAEDVRHAFGVLRLRQGEAICISDGRGAAAVTLTLVQAAWGDLGDRRER